MSILFINVLLALAWAAVTGAFTLINVLFGFVLGSFSLWLIREQVGSVAHYGRVGRALSLIRLFLVELLKSALRVMVLVLSPRMNLSPGFIAFPLRVDTDFEITLLANLITLTPGTLSVDVSDDRSTLYIHVIDIPDKRALIADIAQGFETKIMEAVR